MGILELDSGWYGGKYETNPITAVQTMQWNWILWVFTPQYFAANMKTEEAYAQWKNLWRDIIRSYPQDARDMYYTLQAWAGFNIGDTPGFNGDAKAVLQSIEVPVLIIGAKVDMLFDRQESIFAENTIPKATYMEIDTPSGHAFCVGWDPTATKIMDQEIKKFLSNLIAGSQ